MSAPAPFASRILVPIDGSEHSIAAVSEVIRRRGKQAEAPFVHLLAVDEDMMAEQIVAHLPVTSADAWFDRHGGEALHRCAGMLAAAGIPHATQRLSGSVVETILEQCGALGCDEIVMGTHGRGRLSSALLGSTAAGVVQGARVAVTLVKASGAPAES